jgi:hypothetical protein
MATSNKDEVYQAIVESFEAPVEEPVVEEPAKPVSKLSLPEWKEAVAGLEKAGLVDKGADYFTVRNALAAFQASVDISGVANEGIPTEATLIALKAV